MISYTNLLLNNTAKCLKNPFMVVISSQLQMQLTSYSKVSVPKPFQFTNEELTKITHKLNLNSNDNLLELNVPHTDVKKIELWKSKRGSFQSINDILEIEGIDVKNLSKICRCILTNEPIAVKKSKLTSRQIVTPVLSNDEIHNLMSIVGLHIGASGLGWAKIECSEQKLISWGFKNFSNLSSKTTTLENFEMASGVLNDIPKGDAYVFEAVSGLGLNSQNQLALVMSYLHQVEFNSMLFALLNTSMKHNPDNEKAFKNRIYHLKAKLAARLFQTWVGSEKVSSLMTIQQLFRDPSVTSCSPIQIEQNFKDDFENRSSLDKELMGQSLLLSIAFLDLCVLKIHSSLEAINSTRKKK